MTAGANEAHPPLGAPTGDGRGALAAGVVRSASERSGLLDLGAQTCANQSRGEGAQRALVADDVQTFSMAVHWNAQAGLL